MGDPMTDREFTAEALLAALKALGDDSATVAQTLTDKGCVGERDQCQKCPVAVYVSTIYPDARYVDVLQSQVVVEREIWVQDGGYGEMVTQTIRVEPPDAVADFVGDFDARRYPDLIKESA
jgi:hypothetical protein